jgi:hypothetical protein
LEIEKAELEERIRLSTQKLEERRKVKTLELEVLTLRRKAAQAELGEVEPDGEESVVEVSTGGTKRTFQEESDPGPASDPARKRVGRDPKIEKPTPYDGGSMRRLREYLRQCETAFDLAPDTYVTEEVKVKWVAQFLKGETQDAWYRHVDSIDTEAEGYLT